MIILTLSVLVCAVQASILVAFTVARYHAPPALRPTARVPEVH